MELETESLAILAEAVKELSAGFADLPGFTPAFDAAAARRVLLEAARRMRDNYPYPHPQYAGQMLKPPHPVARLAYALSLWINPNNHALDGGKASSAMEREAVARLAELFGWDEHLGHLASGGTMANLEALWVAGRLHPGERILASSQAHYTHARISEVLGLPFETLPVDSRGRMEVAALEARLQQGGVGTVVVTLGTTGTGAVDPLHEILALRERYRFRVHADAAYGGYYRLAGNLRPETRLALAAATSADSIVIDPHKHGLQPYGCGCILFRDPSVGALYKHDSPYTYFTSAELHLGEIALECSRPGAAAVALWATQRLLPLEPKGAFALGLEACRQAAASLHARLAREPRWRTVFEPELDIVVWAPAGAAGSAISARSHAVFDEAARRGLHLALIRMPAELLGPLWPDVEMDEPAVTCLRSCLMKPEHLDWLDTLWRILQESSQEATR